MKPTHQKIIVGYVLQTYSGDIPIKQEFIASDETIYENLIGEQLDYDNPPAMEVYLPMDMVQPIEYEAS